MKKIVLFMLASSLLFASQLAPALSEEAASKAQTKAEKPKSTATSASTKEDKNIRRSIYKK